MEAKKIVKGVKWAGLEFILNFAGQLGIKLLLAKILLPSDFGIVSMTSIFIAIVTAGSELGMGAALIQKKDDINAQRLYDTAFWTGLIWGSILFLFMIVVVAPFAAYFYEVPILRKLIPFLSLGILLKPLSLIHTVVLTRDMNFRRMAIINNFSVFISGSISILLAMSGLGVWALAANSVLIVFISIPLLYLTTKWKPKLEWYRPYFNEIFGFGMYSTGTSIFSTTTYNIDNLMIGKFLGSEPLGAYALSFSLTEVIRQTVSSILNKVLYPVFGKFQDDKKKLKSYFLKIINLNAIILYPIMSFLAVWGGDLIRGFFGEKWISSIIPLRLLAIAVMVHLMINSFASIFRGMGFPKIEFKVLLFTTLFVLIPGLFIGIKYGGLLGAALAILVNKLVLVIVGFILLNKYIGVTINELVNELYKPILSLLISTLITYFLTSFFIHRTWIITGTLYGLLYISFIFILEQKKIKSLYLQIR
ncbi:MAG: lipopolysaccharide biosynthesis protein [Bacteroidales bacterium]